MLHNKWQNTILGLLCDQPGTGRGPAEDRQDTEKNLSVKEINQYILAWINLDLNLKFREE